MQQPQPVRLEQSFAGHFPAKRTNVNKPVKKGYTFTFKGNCFVVTGKTANWDSKSEYVFEAEVYLDNKLLETVELPTSFTGHHRELFWKYKQPSANIVCKSNSLILIPNTPAC